MSIEFVTGNLFERQGQILVNPVNCQGAMGAGIAKEFRQRYPFMYNAYRDICSDKLLKPGKLWVWHEPITDVEIWNVATKDKWLEPSRIEWVESATMEIRDRLAAISKPKRILIPALGCGNGGLNWEIVKETTILYLRGVSHTVLAYEPQSRSL